MERSLTIDPSGSRSSADQHTSVQPEFIRRRKREYDLSHMMPTRPWKIRSYFNASIDKHHPSFLRPSPLLGNELKELYGAMDIQRCRHCGSQTCLSKGAARGKRYLFRMTIARASNDDTDCRCGQSSFGGHIDTSIG